MTEPLSSLRDIHLPIEFWFIPLTLIILVSVSLVIIVKIRRGFIRTAPLRKALRQLNEALARYAQNSDDAQLVLTMSQLLRQFSQQRWPELDCAQLSGKDWLAFLDSRHGQGDFLNGVGSVLAWRQYSAEGEIDPTALKKLLRRWLKDNAQ